MKYFLVVILLSVILSDLSGQGLTRYGQNASSGTNFVDKNGRTGSSPAIGKNGQAIFSTASLSTSAPVSISQTSMQSGGNITNEGGSPVTERGLCWGTSPNPTTALNKTMDGAGAGTFTGTITGVTFGTIYYIRAYATNSIGTSYGNQVSLQAGVGTDYQGGKLAYILQPGDPGYIAGKTSGFIAASSDQGTSVQWSSMYAQPGALGTALGTGATNTTTIVNALSTAYAAKLCSELDQNGYDDWFLPSQNELNKLYLYKTAIGGFSSGGYWSSTEGNNQIAIFQSFADGIQNWTNKLSALYVRAMRSFPSLGRVTTAPLSSLTSTSVVTGGEVIHDGGSDVTARGVCWNIYPNPTIYNSKTDDGTGTGTFTSSVTGLNPGTTYYIRAYATNSSGTTYGKNYTTALVPGDTYQGGTIFYIFQSGDPGYVAGEVHGLITNPSDLGPVQWGCSGTAISGADGTSIGAGLQNTADIVAGCPTAGIAAALCSELVLNGYDDWFLPSKDELNKLNTYMGGLPSSYWTSTESGSSSAWSQSYVAAQATMKTASCRVRAIRKF